MKSRSLLLALGLVGVLWLPALADTRVVVSAPPPPTVTFSTTPTWELVPGTRVYLVNDAERPDYDLFRYGSSYYIYDNGYWYRASSWNGPFVAVNNASVPVVFSGVPRTEWRSYPDTWVRSVSTRHHTMTTTRTYTRTAAPGHMKHRHHRARGHAYGRSY
jgi:YXWGXW repeat-containing protein